MSGRPSTHGPQQACKLPRSRVCSPPPTPHCWPTSLSAAKEGLGSRAGRSKMRRRRAPAGHAG
eukprot:11699238-Alexandrium_andersonii.AAC.1